MKHISRIEQADNETVGWYVRVYYNSKTYAKFFSDKKFDSKEVALKQAKKWRDILLAWKKKQPVVRRTSYKKRFYYEEAWNKSTGVVGVYLTGKKNRRGGHDPYYQATVVVEKDVPRTRAFSVNKYGHLNAFLGACAFRSHGMLEIHGDRFDMNVFLESMRSYLKSLYDKLPPEETETWEEDVKDWILTETQIETTL